MQYTILQGLMNVSSANEKKALADLFKYDARAENTTALTSANLVINGAGNAACKVGGTDFYCIVRGIVVKISAGTVMPALTGINFTTGQFVIVCFFVDASGNVTVSGGKPGANLASMQWPDFPLGKACIGFLIITYAGTFTGGTTPLDTATTVYFSNPNAFDPTFIYGDGTT